MNKFYSLVLQNIIKMGKFMYSWIFQNRIKMDKFYSLVLQNKIKMGKL
jgi:hypothetical protein